MLARDLRPAQRTARPAPVDRVDDHVARVVALKSDAPEHADPFRLVMAVDEYGADLCIPDVTLEVRNDFRARLRQPLHRPGQVAAFRDGLVDIAASEPHVEISIGLPEHAGVTDVGHDNDGLAGG